MIFIRAIFGFCLLFDFLIVALAGLITGLILDSQYAPGQSLGVIFSFKMADIVIINAIFGGLVGMFCSVVSLIKLMRNPVFCRDSKEASQLPAMAVVWMVAMTVAAAGVVFIGNWIAATPWIDVYMQSNRFLDLLKYWFATYLMLAAAAGVVNGGVIFAAHKYCLSRRKQNDDGESKAD